MILPTKRLSEDRSLLYIAAEVLQLLDEPKTVSRLWHELQKHRASVGGQMSCLTYDWFVLSLDLLFACFAIEQSHGRLRKLTK